MKNKLVFYGLIGYHLLNNFRFKLQDWTGIRITTSGNVLTRPTKESIDRMEFAREKIVKYGGMTPAKLKGKTILEVGPGDNLGLALQLIGMGAKKVTCLDKFSQNKDKSKEQTFYKVLLERMKPNERKLANKAFVTKDGQRYFNPDKIEYIYGVGIEEFRKPSRKEEFDVIVSNSVMEHVQNVPKTFEVMNYLLKKGGRMIHSIDFRDHGMFTTMGFDPAQFLTIPRGLWKLMTSHSGRPNRELIGTYKGIMKRLKYEATFYVAGILWKKPLKTFVKNMKNGTDYTEKDVQRLQKLRPKLSREYRSYSDEELLVNQIVLVGEKK